MTSKRKGLGRGLDALLGSKEPFAAGEETSPKRESEALKTLPVEFLQPGKYQPRRDMHPEALEELADSIKAQGLMQPIVVRSIGDQRYEIIAGERRWRASQLAGLSDIPVVVKQVDDQAAIAMALIENIQREDLNAIEESRALVRLQQEFGLTQQQVAEAVGKSRAAVANLMRLMSLEDEVKKMLEHGDLEMGHGRALLALSGPGQVDAARFVAGKGLTVRQTESLVKKRLDEVKTPAERPGKDADTRNLEENLSERLGAPVSIQHNSRGKGKVVISYTNLDELDGILGHIH